MSARSISQNLIAVASLLATILMCTTKDAAASGVVFSAAGPNPAAIQATVDDFRNALGTLNPNEPVNFPGGRRQIDWDAAPAAVSTPNEFPGDFFNFNAAPRARGIEFSLPLPSVAGDPELRLSGDVDDATPVRFEDLNAVYATEFQAFSEERLFSGVDTISSDGNANVIDVKFFDPSDQTTPATVSGIGVVFVDVDLANSTSIELFDANDNSLGIQSAEVADKGLSFLGITYRGNQIARARITSGTRGIASTLNESPSEDLDLVVMDDFIFGEPTAIPEPSTYVLLMLVGIAAITARRRTYWR